jgi:DNA polymerase-3 subunit delta
MPVISYKDLETYLSDKEKNPFAPVYLIYGEEVLTKSSFDELLNALIPADQRSLNYDLLDGTQESVHEVINRVNTFSLLPGIKVIALRDSRIFYASHDQSRILTNAQKAYEEDNLKKAASHLLHLMGFLNLSFEDINKFNREKSLGSGVGAGTDDAWLDDIIVYCQDNELSVPVPRDDSRTLQQAIEKGFPPNNHLIITTDIVDKRRGLFKTLNSHGMVVDCSVPKGDRRADREVQESVLETKMKAILAGSNKTITPPAYSALYEMTGFDLRTFCNNLEKLVNYVGDRIEITIEDVQSILKRTKKDPIYELTNALAERSCDMSLFFLDSLLSSGIHPLQVFTAMVNQVRKLLLVKDFVTSSYGREWQAACPYGYFQKQVIPAIIEYDRLLMDQIDKWHDMLNAAAISPSKRTSAKSKKKKRKPMTDLVIAKNPKNAYPVYQLFKKSENFSKEELLSAMESLNAADKTLKSSGQSPKLVLEKLILSICR